MKKDRRASEIKKKQTCLLVLGMHRSGTSALTRIFNIAGAKLPATLMGATKGNETGHWESLSLCRYHDSILAEMGSSWNDWRMLEATGLPAKRRKEIKTEIRDIVESEYGDAPLFVTKDPRICRFTSLFIEALEGGDKGTQVCVIIPFRNPLEVCESLERRDKMARADAVLLWLRHVLEAEYASRGRVRVILSDGTWMSNWREVFKAMNTRFDIKWPYKQNEITQQIESFIKQKLRHHSHSSEDVLLDPVLHSWIGEAYQALQVLTHNPNSKPAQKQLDTIRHNFNEAVPVLDSMQSDIRKKSAKINSLKKAISKETEKTVQLEISLTKRDDKLSKNTAELERLNEALQQAQGEAGQLEATLSKRGVEMLQMKEKHSDLEVRATKLNNALASQGAKTNKLQSALLKTESKQLAAEKSFAEEKEALQNKLEKEAANQQAEREKYNALSKQLAESQNKTIKANAILRRLRGSVSWKITAPVRFAGKLMGVLKSKEQRRQRRDMKLIRKSGLFDLVYYKRTNLDLTDQSAPDPLLHYLKYGGPEGRAPSIDFDSAWYLEQNPEVRREGMNPLVHYLRNGKGERLSMKMQNADDIWRA